jgi:hypothetical protein
MIILCQLLYQYNQLSAINVAYMQLLYRAGKIGFSNRGSGSAGQKETRQPFGLAGVDCPKYLI